MVDLLLTPLPSYVYTFLALLFVLGFAWRGYRRGAGKELLSISSLLLSIPLAKPFGWLLSVCINFAFVPELMRDTFVMAIGGVVAYLFLAVVFAIGYRVFLSRYAVNEEWRSYVDWGGAVIAAAFSVLLVFIMLWFVLTMSQIARLAVEQQDIQIEQLQESGDAGVSTQEELLLLPTRMLDAHADGIEESIVGGVAKEVNPVPDELTHGLDIATEILEDPAKATKLVETELMQDLLAEDVVTEFMNNTAIKRMAEAGDIMGVLSHPATIEMLNDPAIKQALENVDIDELMQSLD